MRVLTDSRELLAYRERSGIEYAGFFFPVRGFASYQIKNSGRGYKPDFVRRESRRFPQRLKPPTVPNAIGTVETVP
jgi:hypothetical protein